jgi:translation initiation factor 1A
MSSRRGGKNKRKGKNNFTPRTREIRERDADQEYGWVLKMLGDCRVECICSDEVTRICHIRGNMRRRVWINTGDVVLISMREFEDSKGDIIHKYTTTEAEYLKQSRKFDPQDTQRSSNTNNDRIYETGIQDLSNAPEENTETVIDFSQI